MANTKAKSSKRKPLKEDNILQPSFKKHCSYCGKPSDYAKRLIAGPPPLYPFICDECVEICVRVLLEDCNEEWRKRLIGLLAIQAENKAQPKQEQTKPKSKSKNKGSSNA